MIFTPFCSCILSHSGSISTFPCLPDAGHAVLGIFSGKCTMCSNCSHNIELWHPPESPPVPSYAAAAFVSSRELPHPGFPYPVRMLPESLSAVGPHGMFHVTTVSCSLPDPSVALTFSCFLWLGIGDKHLILAFHGSCIHLFHGNT